MNDSPSSYQSITPSDILYTNDTDSSNIMFIRTYIESLFTHDLMNKTKVQFQDSKQDFINLMIFRYVHDSLFLKSNISKKSLLKQCFNSYERHYIRFHGSERKI